MDFLKHLPDLKSFEFGAFYKIDLSPIQEYVQLTDFRFGGYNIPLKPIEDINTLNLLGLEKKLRIQKL